MSEETPRFTIPNTPRKPQRSIDNSMIWLYGEPKIGKTTFASKFPGAWFISTEPGQAFVETREPVIINDWEDFLEFCLFISETRPEKFGDGTPINTLVIDTYDQLFKMCQNSISHELGVIDLAEIAHGKGWGRLTMEFERVMTKFLKFPYTIVCISHVRVKEIKTRGRKVHLIEPHVGAAGMRWGISQADLIIYAHMHEMFERDSDGQAIDITEQRAMMLQPSAGIVAGGRMSNILPLEPIPLDYDSFMAHFEDPTPEPKDDYTSDSTDPRDHESPHSSNED